MTDDQLDHYAASLCEAAMISTGDAIQAASVLYQAAVLVLISSVGPERTPELMEQIGKGLSDGVRDLYGGGETRQ